MMVVFWGVLLLAGLANIFAIHLLPALNYVSCFPVHIFADSYIVMVHVLGFTAVFILNDQLFKGKFHI